MDGLNGGSVVHLIGPGRKCRTTWALRPNLTDEHLWELFKLFLFVPLFKITWD